MMKILVTGASGNVGSYVIKELLKLKDQVVAAGTNIQKSSEMFGNQVEPVYFDFKNKTTFDKSLNNVDRVFLMLMFVQGFSCKTYLEFTLWKSEKKMRFLFLLGKANPAL
jgi:uncharacterized protein YbjT (DUF2867 family)